MASINDYGKEVDDNLASPPLGGVGGWAEAVAKALDTSDIPVNTRIDAEVAELGTQVLHLTGGDVVGPTTIDGITIGGVYGETEMYKGIQRGPSIGTGPSAGGLIMFAASPGGQTYIMGPSAGTVRVRPDIAVSSGDIVFKQANGGQIVVPGHEAGSEAFASGWSGTVSIVLRAGWVFLKMFGIKKSSTPAAGNTMFTIPSGFRPHSAAGTIAVALVANSSISGATDGLKSYGAYVNTDGTVDIQLTNVPAANVPVYGTVTYPVA